ncbi:MULTISPECIES: TetR/AcrR family transcriptional regulator [Mycobacterium]|uniref:TetR family transcriptional regulator n=1 Tax=Mycobacterium gordonae TaxID=1778 RepID=A0A1A6BI20_MYCGO|nr:MULTISPECIES: TetR/AcrR family transcriptional regulator [Mycobacterium]MBI2700695.1 TetR/AcrR family transcriptional regulator [Mycobacterium sp.]MBX9979438.1 TetR/AcrR family transcriptional regulator [Mycobacterium gordonae]MCQ4362576.1 TetR/AcrR family transcriptional regulator [Mycobacterium gordonae]MCV7005437.1 TetR/AcrR family transcriptional regulator [Mycobacterium gordonae]OBS01978.1 TetR family transcriptional regulator [Mycobacterium gordonae]
MARTQQQRREETVGRLLQACIDTIVEVGYARASAALITNRAGVSVGALFRHFETMGDFMAATAAEVLRRQLEIFTKQVTEIPADRSAPQAVLEILHDVTTSPTHAVLYELLVAARTDDKLRATLQDELGQYSAKVNEVAREMPGADGFVDDTLPVVVALLTNLFDGAAVVEGVLPRPEIAERRIPLLSALITAVWRPPS